MFQVGLLLECKNSLSSGGRKHRFGKGDWNSCLGLPWQITFDLIQPFTYGHQFRTIRSHVVYMYSLPSAVLELLLLRSSDMHGASLQQLLLLQGTLTKWISMLSSNSLGSEDLIRRVLGIYSFSAR